MKHFIFLLIATALFTACESDAGFLRSESPNGLNAIELKATKVIAEPMQVSVEYIGGGKRTAQKVQLYAGSISEENVSFLWATEDDCSITFIEQDGTKKGLLVAQTNGVVGYQSFPIED
jgi:hypothetical protein